MPATFRTKDHRTFPFIRSLVRLGGDAQSRTRAELELIAGYHRDTNVPDGTPLMSPTGREAPAAASTVDAAREQHAGCRELLPELRW